jgi:hypothetical protein
MVSSQVRKQLQTSKTTFYCLTTDGWSNVKNEPILNYMLIGGGMSLFLENICTEEQGHTAQFIADDLSRVIDIQTALGLSISGAVTDNTATNKSAWKLLQSKYPGMFFQGCASHGLHLLVKDIFAATKTKRGRVVADYPDGYPFEYLLNFASSCKDVVSFFSYHHQIKAKLVKEQKNQKLPALIQPAATRWGSLKDCFLSLQKSESILHSIVTARDFISGTAKMKASAQKVFDVITDANFLCYLEKRIAILEPIDKAITLFQKDSVPVSEVYRALKFDVPQQFGCLTCLEPGEKRYLLQLVQARLDFLYGNGIGIAYILDPRYLGDAMTSDEKKVVEDSLFDLVANKSDDAREAIYTEYVHFQVNAYKDREENDFRFKMLLNQSKTVLQYWLIDGIRYPLLQDIALKVFSLVTSSAASERNFSTAGFIHSKLRNSLKDDSVKKLIFIKTNAPQVCGTLQPSDYGCSDEEYQNSENSSIDDVEAIGDESYCQKSLINALILCFGRYFMKNPTIFGFYGFLKRKTQKPKMI